MPVVVFHDTTVHRLLSVAGVYDIVRSDFSVLQSYHDRCRLESGSRLKHITDCIIAYLVIFAVSALGHINDGFYLSGCYFHQYDYTYGSIQLFQFVYQCFFANILQGKGVSIISLREGFDLSTPIGKAMLTMLAAVAELERSNIKTRQMAGIVKAKAEGKVLGRAKAIDDAAVSIWRKENSASIKATAEHFGISLASVKRACRP